MHLKITSWRANFSYQNQTHKHYGRVILQEFGEGLLLESDGLFNSFKPTALVHKQSCGIGCSIGHVNMYYMHRDFYFSILVAVVVRVDVELLQPPLVDLNWEQ